MVFYMTLAQSIIGRTKSLNYRNQLCISIFSTKVAPKLSQYSINSNWVTEIGLQIKHATLILRSNSKMKISAAAGSFFSIMFNRLLCTVDAMKQNLDVIGYNNGAPPNRASQLFYTYCVPTPFEQYVRIDTVCTYECSPIRIIMCRSVRTRTYGS